MKPIQLGVALVAVFVSFGAAATVQDERLLHSAKDGDLAKVKELLDEKGLNLEAGDKDGTTALMAAAEGAHSDIVRALLEAGANANARNHEGRFTLLAAAGSGDTASVLLLIDAGADVNAKSGSGETALTVAEANDHTVISLILVQAGADVNAASTLRLMAGPGVKEMKGRTRDDYTIGERPPLIEATAKRDVEAVKALLDAGVDLNEKEALLGLTALEVAEKEGFTEIAELLRKAGEKDAQH